MFNIPNALCCQFQEAFHLQAERWQTPPTVKNCLIPRSPDVPLSALESFDCPVSPDFASDKMLALGKRTTAQVIMGFFAGAAAAPYYHQMAAESVSKGRLTLPLTAGFILQKALSNALTSFAVPVHDEVLNASNQHHIPLASANAAIAGCAAETLLTIHPEQKALQALNGKPIPSPTLAFLLMVRGILPWLGSGLSRDYANAQQLATTQTLMLGIATGLAVALVSTPAQNCLFVHAALQDKFKTWAKFQQHPQLAFGGMKYRAKSFVFFIAAMLLADRLGDQWVAQSGPGFI